MADTWRAGSRWASTLHQEGPVAQGGHRQFVSQVKAQWQAAGEANARAALEQHPELELDKSIVLDLAYEEYCQRTEAGESVDADEFCRRFPRYETSLHRLLEVHQFLGQHSSLLPEVQPPEWPEPGDEFLGFSLLEELGRGAFARVFLAREARLGNRLVAVKISPQGGLEAETLGKLRHENIVPVYSVQQESGSNLTAVCMPFLGRATFCDLLDAGFGGGRWPASAQVIADAVTTASAARPDEVAAPRAPRGRQGYVDGVLRLVLQLAEGLAYTHAKGVLHLDLKPSNVLLTAEGRPMLLDFNLSLDEQVAGTRLGGTLPYMSPEQIRSTVLGEEEAEAAVDQRSDLFSLGVILYELLCGSLPFGPLPRRSSPRQTGEQLLEQQRSGPRSLRRKNPLVDERLAELIERMLAYEPNERPATAEELAQALRTHLSPLGRTRRWLSTHRKTTAAAVVLAVALMAGAAGYAASLDPYEVRLYRAGIDQYENGEYANAIEYYNRALARSPEMPEVLFARARAQQKAGEFHAAIQDYADSNKLQPNTDCDLGQGFCFGATNKPDVAIACYERALAKGSRSSDLYNALGWSYLLMNRQGDAEKCLNIAIQLDPHHKTAFANRAILDLQKVLTDPGYAPEQGERDIEIALSEQPNCAELQLIRARLFLVLAKQRGDDIEPVFVMLEKARALGLDVDRLSNDPQLSPIHGDPRLKAIVARGNSDATPIEMVHVVDPIRDDAHLVAP